MIDCKFFLNRVEEEDSVVSIDFSDFIFYKLSIYKINNLLIVNFSIVSVIYILVYFKNLQNYVCLKIKREIIYF